MDTLGSGSENAEQLMQRLIYDQASDREQKIVQRNYEEGAHNVRARWSLYPYGEHFVDLEAVAIDALSLRGNETIVDIGMADGRFLHNISLVTKQPTLQLIGIEPHSIQFKNSEFWEQARTSTGVKIGEFILRTDPEAHAYFAEGVATALPLADKSADVVCAMFMLYHLPNAEARGRAIDESKRIMRPEGRFVVATSGFTNKVQHRNIEGRLARYLTTVLEKDTAAPQIMNNSFATEHAWQELSEKFRYVYMREYDDEIRLDTPEKIAHYRNSLLSMRDQFEPVPPAAYYEALVDLEVEDMTHSMSVSKPFRDKFSRSVFICGNQPLDLGPTTKFKRITALPLNFTDWE